MAVLERIRSKAGTIVVIVIGLALFSFVMQDLFSSGNSIFNSRDTDIGEINGETVNGEEFQRRLSVAEENYKRNQGVSGVDDNTRQQLINQIWNEYLDEFLFDGQMSDAGVAVSDDELFDMIQGDNINPQVTQIPLFQDSITKQFDRNRVIKFLKTQLSEENDPDGKYRESWAEFEKSLAKQRVKSKYNTLIRKAVYVTTAHAKFDFASKNTTASVRVLAKKFDTVADSTITVTDEDMKKYYDAHNFEFEQKDETRKVEYVVFKVNPSLQDREELNKNIAALKVEFQTTTDDSAFVNANSTESIRVETTKRGKLGPQIDSAVFSGTAGTVYGPFNDGDMLKLLKLKGFKATSDSVKARHILISTQNGMTAAVALAKADSLKNAIKAGSDFSLLAIQFSEDPGSKTKGGDLGWFTEGMMVPEFNDACFNGNIGDLVTVTTQFGAHLINITEKTKTSNKAEVIYLSKKVEPSTKTVDEFYAKANDFAVSAVDYDAFKKVADEKGIYIVSKEGLLPNDRQVNDLSNSREMVQWAYNQDRKLKEVSKVFDFDGSYVVASLTGIKDKGIPTFDQLKDVLKPLAIREKKGEMFSKQLTDAMAGVNNIDQLGVKMNLPADTNAAITFSSYAIPNHGYEPKVIGRALGSSLNKLSKPIVGINGVFVLQVSSITPGVVPTDWKDAKSQVVQSLAGRVDSGVYTAILKKGNVDDKRYRFF
jgi:peptidyl-prolyl cis-trans isomerase D